MKKIKSFLSLYNDLSIEKKSALWITFCSIVQKGISFITVPIFTRIMSQEDYGVYQVYQSWISFFLIFTSLNLASGCFNNAMIKYENKRDQYLSSTQSLITCITLIWAVVFFMFRDTFSAIMEINPLLIGIMFLELFFEPAYLLWAAKKRFDYSFKSLAIVTLGIAVLMPVVSAIAVIMCTEKATAKILSGALTVCAFYFPIYIINLNRGKTLFNHDFWRFALRFNIPLIPHYLSMTILSQADRIMINNMCGSKDAAIYSIATNVSLVLVIIVNAFNSAIIPWQYRQLKKNEIVPIRKNMNIIVMTASVATSLPIILAPEIVRILAPSEYYEAIWIVPPIATSTFFILVYSMCCNIEFYFEKKGMVMVASLGAAALNIITNYIFIKIFGYIASGYTTVMSYIFLALFHCLFMRRIAKQNGILHVYNYKVILIASILMCMLVVISMVLYNYFIFRYTILGVTLLFIMKNRNNIVNFIAALRNS